MIIIVLPNKIDGLPELDESALSALHELDVKWTKAKLKWLFQNSNWALTLNLKKHSSPDGRGADLSGISEKKDLFIISDAFYSSFIDVNEMGCATG